MRIARLAGVAGVLIPLACSHGIKRPPDDYHRRIGINCGVEESWPIVTDTILGGFLVPMGIAYGVAGPGSAASRASALGLWTVGGSLLLWSAYSGYTRKAACATAKQEMAHRRSPSQLMAVKADSNDGILLFSWHQHVNGDDLQIHPDLAVETDADRGSSSAFFDDLTFGGPPTMKFDSGVVQKHWVVPPGSYRVVVPVVGVSTASDPNTRIHREGMATGVCATPWVEVKPRTATYLGRLVIAINVNAARTSFKVACAMDDRRAEDTKRLLDAEPKVGAFCGSSCAAAP